MAGRNSVVGQTAAPPASYGSVVNNGQLIGTQTSSAYSPINYGGGISAVPSVSPVTVPPSVGYGLVGNRMQTPTGSSTLSSTTPDNANRGAYTGPFIGSPAFWALTLIVIGVLWMRFVHWRKPRGSSEAIGE